MNAEQIKELIVLCSKNWLKSYENSIVAKREKKGAEGIYEAQKQEFHMRMKLRDAVNKKVDS